MCSMCGQGVTKTAESDAVCRIARRQLIPCDDMLVRVVSSLPSLAQLRATPATTSFESCPAFYQDSQAWRRRIARSRRRRRLIPIAVFSRASPRHLRSLLQPLSPWGYLLLHTPFSYAGLDSARAGTWAPSRRMCPAVLDDGGSVKGLTAPAWGLVGSS